jgi:hypothetical protein
MAHTSSLLTRGGQGGEEIADLTMEPHTNRFEHIEADILLRHLEPLQGRLRHPKAAGKRNLPFIPPQCP